MKKKISLVTAILILSVTLVASAYALSPIKIVFDGVELESDVAPINENGRVLVPIRVIAEHFGADVFWDADTNTVQIITAKAQNTEGEKETVANLVQDFGSKLKQVHLLAPETVLAASIQDSYSDYVTAELLAQWLNNPENAPGRQLSSPWPERIDVLKVEKLNQYVYRVKGEIIELTSVELANGGFAAKRPITLQVEKIDNNWLITAVTLGTYSETDSIVYENDEYGFSFTLPESWQGYSIITDKWEGSFLEKSTNNTTSGPMVSIRHPQWTEENIRQDIPIMVFTLTQWDLIQQEKLSVGAAPIGPKELDRNDKYVFALPARYNYAFPTGFEEVEDILENNPLHAF
jgi:hypothetical protein